MVKKLLILAGGLFLLGALFFGRDALSYIGTTVGWVKNSVKDSVPIEFEIERARNMIKDLVPDIRKNMHVIAKEEVEVEQLKKQITEAEARQEKDQAGLMRLKSDLATAGKEVFQYAGHSYTSQQVKTDLANRFERYKTNDATLASLRQIRDARQQSLDAARQKLEGMLAARRQLSVKIESIEAQLKMVEAKQTTSEYQFDDSRLSRVKTLLGDLQTRLNVAERLVDSEGQFHDEIQLEQPTPANIVDQVTEYFQPAPPKAEASKGEVARK
ncbi:MAG: hypothetical protein ACYC35_08010 [Pirellulales bacterium]